MRRGARALTYVALFAIAACGKDVDDPAATFTAGDDASMATAGGTAGSSSSTSDGDDDNGNDQGNDDTTGAADTMPMTTMTTMGAESTGTPTTGPVDDGMDEAGGGCGDGVVSPGEQCDGADLQGFDCSSLGLAGGTLNCDDVTCTFDTSMCMSNPGGTGGL